MEREMDTRMKSEVFYVSKGKGTEPDTKAPVCCVTTPLL